MLLTPNDSRQLIKEFNEEEKDFKIQSEWTRELNLGTHKRGLSQNKFVSHQQPENANQKHKQVSQNT